MQIDGNSQYYKMYIGSQGHGQVPVTETSAEVSENVLYDSVEISSKAPVYTVNNSITQSELAGMSSDSIEDIKELIYKYYHPSEGFISEDTKAGSEKIADAYDILMYAHNNVDSSINVKTGITRGQLLTLTQRDDWEESNYNFFGNINSVFNKIDTDNDGKLSYSELKKFTGYELGSSSTNFMQKVNEFSNQIQQEYEGLSDQKKLEYVIEKTREYFIAAGLDYQLSALERLVNGTDKFNTIHVGQISFSDLNSNNTSDYITLGSYNYLAYSQDDNGETIYYQNSSDNNSKQKIGVWAYDGDEEGYDLGITLDINYYLHGKQPNGNSVEIHWYDLVSTLVHEITHATAYLYSPPENKAYQGYIEPPTTIDALDKMLSLNVITSEEYLYYKNNMDNLSFGSDEYNRLVYLTNCMSGEYMAYQTNEDYLDSIAKGDYAGSNEKDGIINHVNTAGYNDEELKEPKPDWRWWTYNNSLNFNA